jgi:hypothetical protein
MELLTKRGELTFVTRTIKDPTAPIHVQLKRFEKVKRRIAAKKARELER